MSRILIVDSNSASPQLPGVTYYGVEASHSQMCKFDSASAPGFRAVSTDLRQWALDAPALIEQRWAAEMGERAARVQCEWTERMSVASAASSRSPSPAPPYSAAAAPAPPAYEWVASSPPPQYTPAPTPAAAAAPCHCHCCCSHGSNTASSQDERVAAVVRGFTAAACLVAEAFVGVADLAAATVRGRCCCHGAAASSEQRRGGDSLLPQFV